MEIIEEIETTKFKPVFIKIQTLNELKVLWHRLNAGSLFWDDYQKDNKGIGRDLDRRAGKNRMWDLINQELKKRMRVKSSDNKRMY